MAAIDKLYIHEYYEYNIILTWAITYYPELLFYFYNIHLSYEEYLEKKKQSVITSKEHIKKAYQKLGDFTTEEEAIHNLIQYYKNSAHYDCPEQQAIEEVSYILQANAKTDEELMDEYEFPIFNTPPSVDNKLKWICPIPRVREYLNNNCGIKTKWYHKLFWKGKKHF